MSYNDSYIIQPNRIIQTRFQGCTLLMHKIITAIALELQESVSRNMRNQSAFQLDVFKQSKDAVYLTILYSNVSKTPSHYDDVRDALKKLAASVVEIPYKHPVTGKGMIRITGLLKANVPEKTHRSSFFEIEMEKKIIELFVNIDRDKSNTAINYTKYLYQIAQNSTSRYTPPLYKLLASWKNKSVYEVSLDDLKAQLDIPNIGYTRYYDFKKKVLKPVQKDLFGKADLWFDCELDGFKKVKHGKIWLRFRIITPNDIVEENIKKENIHFILKNLGFDNNQLKALDAIFVNPNISKESIKEKIIDIDEWIYNNNKDYSKEKIINKAPYMLTSLLNHFKEILGKKSK